ncbi:MAG: outer membrane lipoprotein carrier protein LolA [Deltaproteobacteria bacterium]|nr:outer membrane lipoprotein carrier protein LolA [Deltaproteobacteria bacterium]
MTSALALAIALTSAAAPAAGTASSAPALDPALKPVVATLQKVYQRTKTFEADFEQTYVNRAFRRTETSTGRVAYSRPGRMRFDYQTPTAKSFLVDGSALWIIQPADHQALVDRCFKADAMTSSLTFLFGQGKLTEQFSISADTAPGGGLVRLVLVPHQPQPAYSKLVLDVDPGTGRVATSTVIDNQGNTNSFAFRNASYDGKLPPNRFVYRPPAGIVVTPIPGSCTPPREPAPTGHR